MDDDCTCLVLFMLICRGFVVWVVSQFDILGYCMGFIWLAGLLRLSYSVLYTYNSMRISKNHNANNL